MITPEKFKQWYKNADLELIAGSHNQEINLDTNLWQGFEVYLHWYKNKNYWDIKRNRFNSKCEVYKIQKRFFSKKYSLLLKASDHVNTCYYYYCLLVVEMGSCYIAQDSLELLNQSYPLEEWDFWCMPPCLAQLS